MKKIIVTDIKYRMAISPIRELYKKGYSITAAEFESVPENERLGFFSKCVSERALLGEDNGFCTAIENLSASSRPVLIPGNRKSLTYVIENRERLEKCCDFVVPSKESVSLADDKNAISAVAKRIGVPIPPTVSLSDFDSIEDMSKFVSYPCIIKFRNGELMGLKPFDRYKIVNNADEFITAYSKMHQIDPYPIASDYITGHDIGVGIVMNKNSEPVSFICYESLREFPIEGGPTCYLKTIFNRQLLKYACSLLKEIKFTGIAMLDFKGSIANPYFLEINPRIWGSAAICEVSGSSFFEDYVKATLDEAPALDLDKCTPSYTLGKKMRFTPQSFACFISLMKHSHNKFEIFKEYFKSFFDITVSDGLFSIKDAKPYIKYITNFLVRR